MSEIKSETTKTLKVGVIGCGSIGQHGHIPGFQNAGVEIAAVVDSNLQRAQEVATKMNIPDAYDNYKKLLKRKDIDLVSIGLPNVLHAPVAIDALKAGKHVLCEKPMTITAALAKKMIAAQQKSGKLLSINQHMRFTPEGQIMRKAFEEGQLGEVYLADMRWTRQTGIPGYGGWFTNKDLAGAGASFDIGVHLLDFAMFVTGFPEIASVKGYLSDRLGKQRIGLGGWGIDRQQEGRFDVDDTCMMTVTAKSGLQIRVLVTWAAFVPHEQRMSFFGDKGGADCDAERYGKDTPVRFYAAGEDGQIKDSTPDLSSYVGGGWLKAISSFVSAVKGESPLMVLPEQTLITTRILELAAKSAATGKEVPFS